ncbi:hypothetical protein [Rathayibacter sp. AY1F6]|uniref:hypothetical protein n=1 Tax=Rathayibacter sp. AY1F6 TaxID=2080560 RepID=UPI0011B0EEE3|nr:hypothetical protein [Rathayibacter sp. AY1F6]
MLDLQNLADANQANLRAKAAATIAQDKTGRIAEFHTFLQASQASSNVDAFKLAHFEKIGRIVDGRAFQISVAGNEAEGLEKFRETQKGYYARRETFEQACVRGVEFIYFALNAGNLGTQGQYGPYCVVVANPQGGGRSVAVTPGDSLKLYVEDDLTLLHEKLAETIAQWAGRADLAVELKHAIVQEDHQVEWVQLICAPDNYIEVIVAGAVDQSDVSSIRISKDYERKITALQRKARKSLRKGSADQLSLVERNELVAFDAAKRFVSSLDVFAD